MEDLYQRGTFYAKSVRGMNSMKDGKTYNAKTLQPLSKNGKQRRATFSPDATKVAFMRDNNLFIKDLATGEEKQFTNDGLYNHIINGAPDWVYEEEFSFSQGFYWSPDSKKIAFMKFDESNVREFQMEEFEGLYPDWYSFKYPKAGEETPSLKSMSTTSQAARR